MNALRIIVWGAAWLIAAPAWVGCGHHDDHDDHDHGREEAHAEGMGHAHGGEESPSGESFKKGKGVMLTAETREILGVEEADVEERVVPIRIDLTMQVFGENHRHGLDANDHIGCDVHGSGFLATDTATIVRPGQSVQALPSTHAPLQGIVLAVQKAFALGESEIIIGVSNGIASLKSGDFIPVRITLNRDAAVAAVPHSAVLRTAEGPFVYVVNGDAYLRTSVRTGAEADGWVEIVDGLFAGDRVVTQPVQALWLLELRATKGGGHSH